MGRGMQDRSEPLGASRVDTRSMSLGEAVGRVVKGADDREVSLWCGDTLRSMSGTIDAGMIAAESIEAGRLVLDEPIVSADPTEASAIHSPASGVSRSA